MCELVKTVFVGFVSSRALMSFGKKEYGEIINLCTWLYLGYFVTSNFVSWYNAVTTSKLAEFVKFFF